MKRIQAACICQTLHFMPKDGTTDSYARKTVKDEVAHYKQGLEHSRTKYKLIDEAEQPDGSIIVKIIKQYNASPVGDYLN